MTFSCQTQLFFSKPKTNARLQIGLAERIIKCVQNVTPLGEVGLYFSSSFPFISGEVCSPVLWSCFPCGENVAWSVSSLSFREQGSGSERCCFLPYRMTSQRAANFVRGSGCFSLSSWKSTGRMWVRYLQMILPGCSEVFPALFMSAMHNLHLRIDLIFVKLFGDSVDPLRQNLPLLHRCDSGSPPAPLPVWLAPHTSPVLAHTRDGCLTTLAFSPYRLIPVHPNDAIKPDPTMHMDQCCSSWFPPLLCLGQKGIYGEFSSPFRQQIILPS